MTALWALDPESQRVAAVWDWYFLFTAVGLIWAYILLRSRSNSNKPFASCILLGIAPTALLWLTLDCTVTNWFQLRVLEAIGEWPEGIEKAIGVIVVGWLSWSYVFGSLVRSRIMKNASEGESVGLGHEGVK